MDIPLPSNSGLEKENSRLIPRGTALERAGVENKTSIWLVSWFQIHSGKDSSQIFRAVFCLELFTILKPKSKSTHSVTAFLEFTILTEVRFSTLTYFPHLRVCMGREDCYRPGSQICCLLQSPGELVKVPLCGLCFRPITSEYLGVGPGCSSLKISPGDSNVQPGLRTRVFRQCFSSSNMHTEHPGIFLKSRL